MDLDPVALSRAQFALTVMFHYLFPPLSIGLGALLVFLEARYHQTGDAAYEAAARFWTKIFAVNFAVGVASGIVMEFEFGTNWSTYSRFVGDVFGSALASEGIFAFFLESGFLAILVFGWDRVSTRMHLFATVMVALGSTFSAVWIVIANSWQQTPAGFHIVTEVVNGVERHRAEITDFWAMVFNPSSVHRLIHVLLGSYAQGAFFVMSIAAFYLLRGRHERVAKVSFRAALGLGLFASVAMFVSGHFQADAVAENQPAKLAAFEGHYHTGPGDMYLLGVPNDEEERVDYGVAVPGGLSFLLHQDFDAPVTGLDQIPDDEEPPVLVPFMTYHVMIALGTYFLAITALGAFLLWRGKLWDNRPLLWAFVFSVVGPYIANETGWVAAEVGRQPWVVYGLLRTTDAVSPTVPAFEILISFILFVLMYAALFAVWAFVLNHKIQHGPEAPDDPGDDEAGDRAVSVDSKRGLIETAAQLLDHGGSLTDATDPAKEST